MKKLFIYDPIFRIISPLFSGVLVYLLILLVNNDVAQLQETFLGQELYVCIALAYIIQEFSILSIYAFTKLKWPRSAFWKLLLHIVLSVALCMLLVSFSMYIYFKEVLNYTPNFTELGIFNSLFSVINLVYLTLYLSHQFLYKVNEEQMASELHLKNDIEKQFVELKKGVNPSLLFESLEALIVLMKKDAESAERLIDHFSSVYRYILSKKDQLVVVEEELQVVKELLKLFEELPYRKTIMHKVKEIKGMVVPGAMLFCVEQIIRSSIASKEVQLAIEVVDEQHYISFCYTAQEKIREPLNINSLNDIRESYRFYSDREVLVVEENGLKKVKIPKLTFDESSNY